MVSQTARLLLRAEIHAQKHVIIGYTTQLSAERAFVQTAQILPVGCDAQLKLSFPRLVTPILLSARVRAAMVPQNPGDDHGIDLELRFNDPAEKARLDQLLALATAAPSGERSGEYRVLLVEDNELICDMFAYGVKKYFKKRAAVVVDVAQNGEEALHKLGEQTYDLAIVDQYLPVMNGAQLVTKLRGDQRFGTLPVIGISVGGDEARQELLAAGADLFLDKPIVLRDLFDTLERLAVLPQPEGARP
jgi:CheY-like chemotaxis protein